MSVCDHCIAWLFAIKHCQIKRNSSSSVKYRVYHGIFTRSCRLLQFLCHYPLVKFRNIKASNANKRILFHNREEMQNKRSFHFYYRYLVLLFILRTNNQKTCAEQTTNMYFVILKIRMAWHITCIYIYIYIYIYNTK